MTSINLKTRINKLEAKVRNKVLKSQYKYPFEIKGIVYNWIAEIDKCITFSSRSLISVQDLIKEIMLRNNIKLDYNNIEKIKYELIILAKSNTEQFSLIRTSEIFIAKHDKKYYPMYNDCYISHLQIRDFNKLLEDK